MERHHYWTVDPNPIPIILLSPVYFTRTVYFTRILSLFSTRYAHTLCFKQTGEIGNLIASWEQSTWLCVCRFHIATGRRRVNKCRKRCPCWSAIKPVRITFGHLSALLLTDKPWFLTEGKDLLLCSSYYLLGVSQLPGHNNHQLHARHQYPILLCNMIVSQCSCCNNKKCFNLILRPWDHM
jgi:hypothetical protein